MLKVSQKQTAKKTKKEKSGEKTTLTLTNLSKNYKYSLERKVKSSEGRWDNLPDFIKHILTELDSKGISYFIDLNKIEATVIAGIAKKDLVVAPASLLDTIKGLQTGELVVKRTSKSKGT